MRSWLQLTVALALSGLCSCSTRFKEWHGGDVQVGGGGACEKIEGIDVWSYGSPSRPFRVIGIIEDSRPGAPIPMAMRAGQVAREAKKRGGDAVIIVNEGKEYRGTLHSLNASSYSNYNTSLNNSWTGRRTGDLITLNGYGTTLTTGSTTTNAMGVSAPIFRAHGLYQIVKYADGSASSPAPAPARTSSTNATNGSVKMDRHGTAYLE